MAEDDLRKGSNLIKFIKSKIGITESQVNPNKQINELFGVADEPKLQFSTQSALTPDKDNPVGTLREKETGAIVKEGKGEKTFKGLSDTKEAVKDLKNNFGYTAGMLVEPENMSDEIKTKVQKERPFIEGEKRLKTGFTFPEPKIINGAPEPFEAYYKRIKTALPSATSIIALQNEVAKQYAMKFPNYKKVPKTVDLLQSGLINFDSSDPFTELEKGVKIPSRENTGIRKIVTETLEQNEGYVTKEAGKSIDKAIKEYVDSIPQKDFDKFAVDLLGEVDPSTKKPYTKAKIKNMLSDRIIFAASKYFNQAVTPEILDEVMSSLRGSQSAINVGDIAEQKVKQIGGKKIGAFTAALTAIIKSGNASDLLASGTKAVGFGLPFELLFPNKAEAAELMSDKERKDLRVRQTFGIDSL